MQEVFLNIIEQLEEKANIEGFDCEEYEDEIKMQCYHDAIEIVKQEAAEYNNGWIPSSESIPCESGYYLVTYHEWSNGDYLPKYDDTYVRRLHYQRSEHFVGWNYPHCVDEMAEADTNREVIAWMNLPAPYQPKGE